MEKDCFVNNTQYYCAICDTTPDQISHHKAHLKTQKHIYKKKCFEQCVNMTIFHIYNSKNMSREDIIKMFEDDTGNKYIKTDKESVSQFMHWRINRESFLLSEYPKIIIPEPKNESYESAHDEWFKKIIETNETIVIKPIKKDINVKKDNSFKENINNQNLEELIIKAIEIQSEFDIAIVFYKLFSEKYSFKSFIGNVWIDKSNISLSSKEVLTNVRNEINTTLKVIFENFRKTIDIESELYNSCLRLIQKINKTAFKNNIIKEARELFFDN